MEPTGELSDNMVTFVVSHRVKAEAETQYPLCQSYAGHPWTHIIRVLPRCPSYDKKGVGNRE